MSRSVLALVAALLLLAGLVLLAVIAMVVRPMMQGGQPVKMELAPVDVAGTPSEVDLERARQVVQFRLERLGANAVTVGRNGERISVEALIPLRMEPGTLRESLTMPGHLEFLPAVHDPAAAQKLEQAHSPGITVGRDFRQEVFLQGADCLGVVTAANEALGPLPAGQVVDCGEFGSATGRIWRSWLLDRADGMDGSYLVDATPASEDGRWEVKIRFSPAGAAAFADLTGRLVNQTLAIVLDGQVMSSPTVNDAITGGAATLTLGGSADTQEQEARGLAVALRGGVLPFRLGVATISQPSDHSTDINTNLR